MKELRNQKDLTQLELAKIITVSRTLLNQYETKTFPPVGRLLELSRFVNLSIHAMTTGKSLTFVFYDKFFGKIILSADQGAKFFISQQIIREYFTVITALKTILHAGGIIIT